MESIMQKKIVPTFKKCWVDFHPEYMDIMDFKESRIRTSLNFGFKWNDI